MGAPGARPGGPARLGASPLSASLPGIEAATASTLFLGLCPSCEVPAVLPARLVTGREESVHFNVAIQILPSRISFIRHKVAVVLHRGQWLSPPEISPPVSASPKDPPSSGERVKGAPHPFHPHSTQLVTGLQWAGHCWDLTASSVALPRVTSVQWQP